MSQIKTIGELGVNQPSVDAATQNTNMTIHKSDFALLADAIMHPTEDKQTSGLPETVKDLVELYKESLEEEKLDFERYVQHQNHQIAHLNSLDPATKISPAIWKDYKPRS